MLTRLVLAALLLAGCPAKPDDTSAAAEDADGDGYPSEVDCDDGDAAVYPGASERCNGRDDDCDGFVDDADPDLADGLVLYHDTDGDGWGDPTLSDTACEAQEGWVEDGTDCDDADADVHPGAQEICNGADEDCDGEIDEDGALESTWYLDADQDGWGTDEDTLVQCEQPADYVLLGGDCDDTASGVHPEAEEHCDGLDEDCDGEVDEDAVDAATWYADADGDGFGDAGVTIAACTAPGGFVSDATDCDDGAAGVHPGAEERCDGVDEDCDGATDDEAVDAATWFADADGDGFGDAAATEVACTAPAGTTADATDCDDGDAGVHPGATETCDGSDQDCDGATDEEAADAATWYADADGDGYGDAAATVAACSAPAGTTADATDCDDGDASVHPGASEVCDGADQDCDGATDEEAADASAWYADADGDGYGTTGLVTLACTQPSGTAADPGDCDDGDAAVSPGADETCDGVDQDCDGAIDEDALDAATWYADADGDGYGATGLATLACTQPSGTAADPGDCDDGDAAIHPGATEHCDGVDEDCDGTADEGAVDRTAWYADADGDGFGSALSSTLACTQPAGSVATATDCDDGDAGIHPGATEHCDDVDEDCDGSIDESAVDRSTWYQDADGDGYGDATGARIQACDQPSGYTVLVGDCDDGDAAVHPGATERCNGQDDDCDGTVDGAGLATFVSGSGTVTDMTATFASGSSTTSAAVSLASSGTLTLCPGTFNVEIQARGADLAIVGQGGSGSTVLSGDGSGSVVTAYSTCLDLALTGLTLEGGGSVSAGGGFNGGTHGVAAVLDDVVVQDCTATYGGGIYLSAGSLDGLDVVVESCTATYSGGGLYVASAALDLTDTLVDGNDASYYYGGGMYTESCTSTFDGLTVSDSYAYQYGGGAYLRYGSATLTGCSFDGNSTAYGGGGLLVKDGTLAMGTSEVVDNTATTIGAGLYVTGSTATVTNSQIQGNSTSGAGAGIFLNNAASVTCIGSTSVVAGSYDNTAYWGGGALFYDYYSTLTSSACDWGHGSTDNSPNDVAFSWSSTEYKSYRSDASFTCNYYGCS